MTKSKWEDFVDPPEDVQASNGGNYPRREDFQTSSKDSRPSVLKRFAYDSEEQYLEDQARKIKAGDIPRASIYVSQQPWWKGGGWVVKITEYETDGKGKTHNVSRFRNKIHAVIFSFGLAQHYMNFGVDGL